MPKVDIPLALIKTAAVGGIGLVWVNFTLKAFKMVWDIISTSPEEDTCLKIVKNIFLMTEMNWNMEGFYVRLNCRN